MPYKLKPAGKGKATVVSTDTGKKHSKKPIPTARAKAQMRAMYANVPDARRMHMA